MILNYQIITRQWTLNFILNKCIFCGIIWKLNHFNFNKFLSLNRLGQRSDLRYSPVSELDYGTLLCWATNAVGTQKVPCTFTVFPAGKPDTVTACRAFNETEETVAVVCEPGYSGGVNQSFLLQAWDDGALRATDRSDSPIMEVRDSFFVISD